jgi:hypothetical protein
VYNELLSIIIYVDEQMPTLPRLLQTIRNQHPHGLDYEIIIGTSDSKVIAELQQWNTINGDNTIYTCLIENGTCTAEAKNQCLLKARGSCFTCLTQDNRLSPDYMRSMEQLITDTNPPDIIYPDHLRMPPPEIRSTSGYASLPDFNADMLRRSNILGPAVLVRKRVWEAAHFRSNAIYHEWDLWIQATLLEFSFAHIQECLVSGEVNTPGFRQRAEDGRGKALLVINNHAFFHMHTVRWAMAYLRGDQWASPWAFMRIPTSLEVTQMMHDHCVQKMGGNRLQEQAFQDFQDEGSTTEAI